MSSETAISMIETVKNKLQKYIALKQSDKVKEYLLKLQNTSITPALLRDTKIDVLVSQLALNNQTPYYSTAKNLLKKWEDKNLLAKTTDSSKVKTITNTNKTIVEKKLPIKRKSIDDNLRHSNGLSESQSSDDYKNIDQDQSSSIKKRKVLSIAEYVSSKKPITSSSSTEKKLSDTPIEEIYAQFNANYEEFAAKAPVLSDDVNKKLIQNDLINSNRNDLIANGHNSKMTIIEKEKTKQNDIWAEDDDDDDDDDGHDYDKQQIIKQSQPVKNNQQITKPVSTPTAKTEDHSLAIAIASSIANLEHVQPSSRSSQSQSIVLPKKPVEAPSFLRSKQGPQAIYSGKRTLRTNIPSLQDLCVETLKEHVDMACRTHFNRLPYDIVKPILDSATPEQLYQIIDSNPDYVDDAEPLWQRFCLLHFKEAQREDGESFYELYWRKSDENEQRLKRITQLAKRRQAETVDTARQTKPLNIRPTTNRHVPTSNKIVRQVVGLPASKPFRGQTKVKKPPMPPLLKKTLKSYNGKS